MEERVDGVSEVIVRISCVRAAAPCSPSFVGDLLFDLEIEAAASSDDIQVGADVSRSEPWSVRGLFYIEHDHRGPIAPTLEEKDVRLVGPESDAIRDAIESYLVEVERDVLGDAIERKRLCVCAGTTSEQRKSDSAGSNRRSEDTHNRSLARVAGTAATISSGWTQLEHCVPIGFFTQFYADSNANRVCRTAVTGGSFAQIDPAIRATPMR